MRLSIRHLVLLAGFAAPAFTLAQPPAEPGAAAIRPHRRGADPALVRTLQDHRWTLQAAADALGTPLAQLMVPGHAFVLHFDGARVSVQGGCNLMTGSWRLSPQDRLGVGRLAATMKACDPALMRADQAIAALLAEPLDVVVAPGSAPTLRLKTADRRSLIFSGQPTPQSLYGKPTRIFLEVAPRTVDCLSGVQRTQCLRVRERHFDAQGLPVQPPGEWQIFHGRIQGYTHQPGVRSVVRIDRFERARVPADASRYVYVLDMVVESEIVSK